MKNYFELLKKNPLFADTEEQNLNSMLECLGVFERSYKRGEFLLHEGEAPRYIGVVLTGAVNIIKSDFGGNETIVARIGEAEMFGEAFVCAEISHSPVSVSATQDSRVLYIDFKKVVVSCENNCVFHTKLIAKMLQIMATKNVYLNKKIDIISKKSLREKILCYLEYERKGEENFIVAFNRQQMADYLCSDRSALSGELSKMQRDGIIEYKKNVFKILP